MLTIKIDDKTSLVYDKTAVFLKNNYGNSLIEINNIQTLIDALKEIQKHKIGKW